PDGLIDRGAYNAYGHDGQLLATTDGVKAMFALSRETTIKITTGGELSFGPNGNSATKAQNSGSLHVLIQRVEAQ
ncbi:MAG: hypothetical protein JWN51_3519, partial [Phycisphaerales bacterium]|nr:hypothetical protein [Phycisphaerales bacterium]